MADRRRSSPPDAPRPATSPARPVPADALASPQLQALQTALGYRFHDLSLLQLALTHRSHTYEATHELTAAALPASIPSHPGTEPATRNLPGTDNEQLEFLGDAVLGLAVTDILVREFPSCDEGELTRLRSSLVSRKRMAELGDRLGLGEVMRLGVSAERNGGRSKPALLANASEAVLAAVFLDLSRQGANALSVLQDLLHRLLIAPELPAMHAALEREPGRGVLRDPKSTLQERVQAAGTGRILYVDTAQTGPPHRRRFAVEARLEGPEGSLLLASAEGSSKKEAQQRAAELALATGWPGSENPSAVADAPLPPAAAEVRP